MTKTTPQKSSRPKEIGILAYPGSQLAAIYGLTDLFVVANRIACKRQSSVSPVLVVSHWGLTTKGNRVTRIFSTDGAGGGKPTVLIVPPTLGDAPTKHGASTVSRWLKRRYTDGTTLTSVCAGAFLLAETGLLAGRSVTTHWSYVDSLTERFPELCVKGEELVIDEGDIITAGGLMAWIDLGLRLVERLVGTAIMAETARFLLVDPPGREQRQYSRFLPRLQHGDTAILRVQQWLAKRSAQDVSLASMSALAGLTDRTFERRFEKATGFSPLQYCQNLRINKARELLESQRGSVESVAFSVGYQDVNAFRKLFRKITGLSPAEYRGRFHVIR
jgi:transcriptional regulator GlxA family with amidase domain